MRTRSAEAQSAFALRQAESGTPLSETARKMGVTEQSFYRWRKRYGGLGVPQIRPLRKLEGENHRLKRLAADLMLDKQMLQDVLSKKL